MRGGFGGWPPGPPRGGKKSPVPPRGGLGGPGRGPQIVAGLVVILVIAGLLGWLLAARDDGRLEEVRQRGVLWVGLDASFPPFESLDPDGQVVGLDADIARAVAADLGVGVEFVNIGFDGLYDALLARRVDLVFSSLPYDPRRTRDVAYTRHYFNAGQVLVRRAGDGTIAGEADLPGRGVAVEWGSQGHMEGLRLARALAKQGQASGPDIDLRRYATAAEALAAVLDGEAEAAIVDAPSIIAGLGQGLQVVTYVSDEWYAGAVHIDSRALLAAVNASLAGLEESGKLADLQAYWFRPQAP